MASSGGEWVWDECHRNTVIVMSLYSSLWLVSLFQVGRILWFRYASHFAAREGERRLTSAHSM